MTLSKISIFRQQVLNIFISETHWITLFDGIDFHCSPNTRYSVESGNNELVNDIRIKTLKK